MADEVCEKWRGVWVRVLTADSVERGKFPLRNIVAAHDLRRTGVLVETTEEGKLLADGSRWGICEA